MLLLLLDKILMCSKMQLNTAEIVIILVDLSNDTRKRVLTIITANNLPKKKKPIFSSNTYMKFSAQQILS